MLKRAIAVTVAIAFGATPALAQTAHQHNHASAPDSVASPIPTWQGNGTTCPSWQMMGTPNGMMGMMGASMVGTSMTGMNGLGMAASGMMGMPNSASMARPGMAGMGSPGPGMMSVGLPGPQQIIALGDELDLSPEQIAGLEDVQARSMESAGREMGLAAEARDRAVTLLDENPEGFDEYSGALREVLTHIAEANIAVARGAFEARVLLTPEQKEALPEALSHAGEAYGRGMMMGGRMSPSHHEGGMQGRGR